MSEASKGAVADRQSRLWGIVAPLAPIPAVAVGAYWMRAGGAAALMIVTQWVSLALGLAAYLGLRRVRWAGGAAIVCGALFVPACAATLAATGMEGVHRWLSAGPMRLHVSFLLAPAAIAAIAALVEGGQWTAALGIALLGQCIHVAQPDAGSASAFAAGVVAVLATGAAMGMRARAAGAQEGSAGARGTALGAAMVVGLVGGAAAAWIRPDPLLPVVYTEGILELAASGGAWARASALDALVLAPVVIGALAFAKKAPPVARMAAAGVGAHLAGAAIASRFGAFPVPLLGHGASPILGAYLGMGLAAGLCRFPGRT